MTFLTIGTFEVHAILIGGGQEKDKLFAYINLNDDEAAVYDRYYRHFKEQLPTPDLVVYLKAPIRVLRERIERKNVADEAHIADEYIDEVVRAYEHFFAHYKAADVLVVDTSKVRLRSPRRGSRGIAGRA